MKKPLITTLMLTILGAMFFLVSGKKQEKSDKKAGFRTWEKSGCFREKAEDLL